MEIKRNGIMADITKEIAKKDAQKLFDSIGTFTLTGATSMLIDKLPEQEIFTADAAVKLTKVAVQSA